jgi:hypothetical protein
MHTLCHCDMLSNKVHSFEDRLCVCMYDIHVYVCMHDMCVRECVRFCTYTLVRVYACMYAYVYQRIPSKCVAKINIQ